MKGCRKKITLQLDTDVIQFIKKNAKLTKSTPSAFVEFLIGIQMAKMKRAMEDLLPHNDFQQGGFVNFNPSTERCGESIVKMSDLDKKFSNTH